MAQWMSDKEIASRFRQAANKRLMIEILSDLTLESKEEIMRILITQGIPEEMFKKGKGQSLRNGI